MSNLESELLFRILVMIGHSSISMVNRTFRSVHISPKFANLFPKNVFSEGGGFSLPPLPDHFQFLCGLQKDVSASLGDVSVAMLEYCEPHPIPAPIAP
jgi:hypothetical protein